jgi:pimeloyl-ACP methyl ester carboxylesterase
MTARRFLQTAIGLIVLTSLPTMPPGAEATSRGTPPSGFQPSFETIPCPAEVANETEPGSVLSCGFLTVLEDRAHVTGRTIRLFVVEAAPESGETLPDPIFVPGRDLTTASPPGYPFGYRAGRVTISMDRRGAGRSEPNLACPEVRQLTDPGTSLVLGSPQTRPALLQAVEACHERLAAQGIDLGMYNLAEMAADAEDLRVALGIDEWNLLTYGTASAISFEMLRRYPEHIRSATFDSPMPPTIDRFTAGVLGTEYAFDQIVAACSAKRSCDHAYPRLHAAWNAALRGLDEHPAVFSDEDLDVVVDDATAVRYLRNNMARGINETTDIAQFPLAVYELRRRGWENGGRAGDEVGWTSHPPFFVGYEPQWGSSEELHFEWLAGRWGGPPSEGTFYSSLCHDEAPFVDDAALAKAAGARPWYVDAYVDNPYPEICDRWDAGRADIDPHDPVETDIPVLLMSGRFDPYSPYPLVKQGTKSLSNSLTLRVPARSRNVLSVDCTVEIRDAFVMNPVKKRDTSCLADIHRDQPIRFVPPPSPTRDPRPGEAVITTVAGDGAFGSSGDGNQATDAQLAWTRNVVVDEQGNLYVSDGGGRVRKVDPSGRISTVVGPPTGDAAPQPGEASSVDITAGASLGIDGAGNLYVGGGDGTHRMILRVDPNSGEITRIAGTGEKGDSGDGGPATGATMSIVKDLAVDAAGNVYFADFMNNRIRVVDASGVITTFAGTGEAGFSGDGGPATEAMLRKPTGVALDDAGNLYIADRNNHRVRRVDDNGIITTIAGNGKPGYLGDGGPATSANVDPRKVVLDARGNIYIRAGEPCGCIRMVDRRGIITTVVGRGTLGFSGDEGPARLAQLSCCGGMAFGPDGALYIAEEDNWRVRKVVFS